MRTLLLFLLSCTLAVAVPEIVTEIKVSAFCYTADGALTVNPYLWSTNCGMFIMEPDGSLRVNPNTVYDFFWSVSTNGDLILRP